MNRLQILCIFRKVEELHAKSQTQTPDQSPIKMVDW